MKQNKLLKNIALAILMAIIMGLVGASFNFLASKITALRAARYEVCHLMPFVGLALVFLYKKTGYDKFAGSDDVIRAIRGEKDIPLIGSFTSYFGMHLTNLSEASAGREGGGFQIGAPIAMHIFKKLNIEVDRACLIICAVAATFAPIWGMPLFALLFALEIENGRLKISHILPAAFSSYGSLHIANLICPFKYSFPSYIIDEGNFIKYILMAIAVSVISTLIAKVYLKALDLGSKAFSKIKNAYLSIFIGGVICVIICAVLDFSYIGGSGPLISSSFSGDLPLWAIVVRLFTLVVAIKSGYKTGLLTQTFTMGAMSGCLTAMLLGFPTDICSMLGIICMFTACYNTKFAAMAIALYSLKCIPSQSIGLGIAIFAVAIALTFLISGKDKIYKAQGYENPNPIEF